MAIDFGFDIMMLTIPTIPISILIDNPLLNLINWNKKIRTLEVKDGIR